MGSSIIKWAQTEAVLRSGGCNLNLERVNATLWWQGYSGLQLLNLTNKLSLLKKVGPGPGYILLHCGGNDIGRLSIRKLRLIFIRVVEFLETEFPGTKIIWSSILPRMRWRYSSNIKAMDKTRRRLNSFISQRVHLHGGSVIQHPDISQHEQFFLEDGVHLSKLGSNIFLNSLQAGLEKILFI